MILAISGSLRRSSVNSSALRAAATAAAQDGNLVFITDSARILPPFDPDLEAAPPDAVLRFRSACRNASAVLLAVPEYAFGIPGSFKNVLDWTVGDGSLYQKPVALLSVATAGRVAYVIQALELVLRALDADVARYSVPIAAGDRDPSGEIADPRLVEALHAVVAELVVRVGQSPRAGGPAQQSLSPR